MLASIERFFALCITLCLVMVNSATAHEIRPAIADLYVADGVFQLEFRLNLEAIIADIGAGSADSGESDNSDEYDRLRGLSGAALNTAFDRTRFVENFTVLLDGKPAFATVTAVEIPDIGDIDLARNSVVVLSGEIGKATTMQVGWAAGYGQIIIRLIDGDVDFDTFLTAGALSVEIPIKGGQAQSFWQVFSTYVFVGFDHIVPKGLDHILFVVGLFLLSTRLHPLFWQITTFTLAHSVTLGLGILGIVTVSPAIVEPLIAASIVYICVENIFMSKLSRWRPVVIFGFGLLHGLGFAGALTSFGLSQSNLVPGLIGFNVGVEIGQILVILVCFLAVGFWFSKREWYRRVITIPASVVIAIIASYWVVERTLL